jgi:hypothetical protein
VVNKYREILEEYAILCPKKHLEQYMRCIELSIKHAEILLSIEDEIYTDKRIADQESYKTALAHANISIRLLTSARDFLDDRHKEHFELKKEAVGLLVFHNLLYLLSFRFIWNFLDMFPILKHKC